MSASESSAEPLTRVIVRNLPKHLTLERFRTHFGKIGAVTDARIAQTKDGRSRLFGFVGYRKPDEARRAVSYFHRTFVDTSRVEVELAKPVGDATLGRPWSRYSKGSSRYAQLHPSEQRRAKSEPKARTKRSRGSEEEGSGDAADAEELQRFLAAMEKPGRLNATSAAAAATTAAAAPAPKKQKRGAAAAAETPAWEDGESDDDDDDDDDVAAAAPPKSVKVETARVESKKPGGKGVFLRRTHVRFDEEDDGVAEEGAADAGKVVGVAVRASKMQEDDNDSGGIATLEQARTTEEAKPKEEEQQLATASERAVWEDGRLFVRNLPFLTTEQDLHKLFRKFGTVSEVHIPIDHDTKKSKGFAFVLFMNPADAVKAYTKLDGSTFQGRLLHILPARAAPTTAKDTALTPGGKKPVKFKEQLAEKQRALAQNPFNWNSLFVRQDTATTAMAARLDVDKGELLDHDSSNLAVRVALSEAHIIAETKQALQDEGVNVAELEKGPSVERSTTTILVKNIPAHTKASELSVLFEPHGEVLRVVLPPSCALAIVEMAVPNEARSAFRALAYRRFRHVPLFLEWAPAKVFTETAKPKPAPKHKTPTTPSADASAAPIVAEEKAAASAPKEEEEAEDEIPQDKFSVYVKNLSFNTTESMLQNAFEAKCGSGSVIRSVTIPRKRDPARPGEKLSMGFGFVEYNTREDALRAVRLMQGHMLEGHALEVSISKPARMPEGAQAAEKALARRTASAAVAATVPKTTKLLVRNVPFEATRRELRELFVPFAQVKSVRLPKRFDGRHRGFAFVEFLTKQEAAAAFEAAKSLHFYGRHLVVEYAAAKDEADGGNDGAEGDQQQKQK